MSAIIYRIFDIWLWLQVLRISWVRNDEGQPRVMNGHTAKELLHYDISTFYLSLFILVDVLLIVGNNSLGKCLSNGVDLRYITSSSDSNPNIKVLESLESEEQDGFKDFDSEGLRLQELYG